MTGPTLHTAPPARAADLPRRRPEPPGPREGWTPRRTVLGASVAAAGLGCLALAARSPSWAAVAALAAVGMAGVLAPIDAPRAPGWPARGRAARALRWTAVAAAATGAFLIARRIGMAAPVPWMTATAAAALLAAVCEEALFRRLLYGILERWGTALAVAGAALAFALVHVPGYGWAALPLNLAAGLVFGWQRWATGGWSAAALTHAAANLIQMSPPT